MSVTPSPPEPAAPHVPGEATGEPGPLGEVDRSERALSALTRILNERHTQLDIARRSGHDLPPASWALLEHLDARGSMRVSDVAACHGVDVSSVTPRLKALGNAGLVSRRGADHDRRVALITLTDEGRRALEDVHAARAELLHRALEAVGEQHLSAATEVLSRVTGHLSERGQNPGSADDLPGGPRSPDGPGTG